MKTKEKINRMPGDLVVAADGGYAQDIGCFPDIVIGDFDSLGYIPDAENVQVYPSQKDDTDMMLAVKCGLERGYQQFVLYGGLGGRLDHTLANLQVLAYLYEKDCAGILKSENTDVYFVGGNSKKQTEGRFEFSAEAEGIFSLFAYGGPVSGVFIEGGKYELSNGELTDAFPLGVSNEFIGKKVRIRVLEGRLLVVHEKESK